MKQALRTLFYIGCAFFLVVVAPAQTTTLTGLVSLHNSTLENENSTVTYLPGIRVHSHYAEPVLTDEAGRFELQFSYLKKGVPVTLKVDAPGYTVVNTAALQRVILGEAQPCRIFLAKAQTVEQEIKAFTTVFQENSAGDVMPLATTFAEQWARVNLDFAHPSVKEAYPLAKAGKVEAAMRKLGPSQFEPAKEGEDRYEEQIERLELLGTLLQLDGAPAETLKVYEVLLNAHAQSTTPDTAKMILTLQQLTALHQQTEQLNKARQTALQAKDLGEQLYLPWQVEMVEPYRLLAEVLSARGENQKANGYIQQAQQIAARQPSISPAQLLNINWSAAKLSEANGDYFQGLAYLRQWIELAELRKKMDPNQKIAAYGLAATFNQQLERPEEALNYLRKATVLIDQQTQSAAANNAFWYTKAADFCMGEENELEALAYLQKALPLQRTYLRTDHPDRMVSENLLKTICSESLSATAPCIALSKPVSIGDFQITKSTSLREGATHRSKVLKRLSAGQKVALLEKTDEWWWKVNFEGTVGWVKKALLERKKE